MFCSKKTISIQQTTLSAEVWLHIDVNGTILEHSANLTKSVFFKLTGLTTTNFQNKNIFAFIDRNSKKQLSLSLKKVIGRQQELTKVKLLRKNDQAHYFLLEVSLTENLNVFKINLLSLRHALQEIKLIKNELLLQSKRINYLHSYDQTTKLLNEESLRTNIFAYQLTGHKNNEPFPFALLSIGLDNYAEIVHLHGINSGKKVLHQVSQRLLLEIPEEHRLFHLENGTFMLLLPLKDNISLSKTIEKIKLCFNLPFNIQKTPVLINVRLGASLSPQDGETDDEIIEKSRSALEIARSKQSEYHIYDSKIHAEIIKEILLKKELTEAIINQELDVYAQTKYSLHNEQPSGLELLLRWKSPSYGTISPEIFITLAEQEQLLINRIGYFVISQACSQLKKFEEKNIRLPVAINISPLQLADDDSFIDTLQENLSQLKDPSLLEIELTESYVDKNKQAQIAEKLCEIKKLQVKVTIDDFGSGAASLKTLLYYKVDAIKLDQSLIINVVSDAKAQKLVKMAIEFGHDPDINAKIIAERVETKEQLELLKNLGCDEIQGYLFSKPQPLTETEKYFLQQVNNKK